jgi:CysZ protein
MNEAPARPGTVSAFAQGFLSVFRGIGFIARTRRAWIPALVPALVFMLLSLAGMFLAIQVVAPAVVERLPVPVSTFGRYGVMALRVGIAVITTIMGVLVAASLSPALSGPALERIIVLRERELGLPERASVSWLLEFWTGLRAQLVAIAVSLPLLAVLWGATLAFPPIAVVTFPLKLLIALTVLVWSVLDYPLSLRGMPLRRRVALLRAEWPRVLGFGAGVGLLFAIPLGAIVLLPAAVAASTEMAIHGERSMALLRITESA